MRALVAVLVLAVAASALTDAQLWASFKSQYNKAYSTSEEAQRFAIFVSNMRKAERLTAEDGNAVYGVTQFSDLTSAEFIAKHTGLDRFSHRAWTESLPPFPFTTKSNDLGTDWTSKVTSVKDQGSCGSCWAFSATAAAEGCLAITAGGKGDLSPQQIMDCCDVSGCDGGCNGGFEYTALEWAMQNDLAALKDYPYKGAQGTCKAVTNPLLPAGSCKFYQIAKTEKAMVAALEHSTVTIALDANALQLYTSGVLSKCSGTSLNHALLLVSDAAEGSSYKIKNSWGASWGEKGYFRMVKDKGCLGINLDYHSVAY